MIRVLIVEDQAMVLGALAALIEIEEDITVVGQARDGEAALKLAAECRPDVVLTDIEMPGMGGLELAAELQKRPNRPRVIILTTFARPGYLRRALDAGAAGYLLKDSPSERLADAIRRVRNGQRAVDPELAVEAWTDSAPATRYAGRFVRIGEEAVYPPTSYATREVHLLRGVFAEIELSDSAIELPAGTPATVLMERNDTTPRSGGERTP
jgi:two-component system response regulator DesR